MTALLYQGLAGDGGGGDETKTTKSLTQIKCSIVGTLTYFFPFRCGAPQTTVSNAGNFCLLILMKEKIHFLRHSNIFIVF